MRYYITQEGSEVVEDIRGEPETPFGNLLRSLDTYGIDGLDVPEGALKYVGKLESLGLVTKKRSRLAPEKLYRKTEDYKEALDREMRRIQYDWPGYVKTYWDDKQDEEKNRKYPEPFSPDYPGGFLKNVWDASNTTENLQ